jgi:solute carrier family 25 (mitochondrial oxoglutarate transporter), member 11
MSSPSTNTASEIKNFLIGGFSGMIATTVILPIDYIKVQLQVLGEGTRGATVSPLTLAKTIYVEKGAKEFYSGLDSALMRQAIYATIRLGLYKTLSDKEKERTGSSAIPFYKKCQFSTIAGGIGSFIANPCDLTLVRLQTDQSLPEALRRKYTGFFNALIRIPKEEGIKTYWKGSTPTIIRACAMNFGMLAPYDQCKEYFDNKLGVSAMNRIYSSVIAAFCACVASLPFDNIKTKYQRMAKAPDGKYPYNGFLDCLITSVRREGILGLYVGFPIFLLRIAPHAIITLLSVDLLHYLLD